MSLVKFQIFKAKKYISVFEKSHQTTENKTIMLKYINYLKFLQFPFTILSVYYIFVGSYFSPNMDDVGFGVLCTGIAFGFGSMEDMTKITPKEEKLFANKKRFNRTTIFLTTLGLLMIATTIVFMSQKWIHKNELGEQYYQLGLNCFPLVIAVFFSLKQHFDKKQYYELKKEKL